MYILQSLLDYMDGLYPKVLNNDKVLFKKEICRISLSIRYHTNKILCWYYQNIRKKHLPSPEECDYIISLTTYPARMDNVWRVIEMMFNQRDIQEKYAVYLSLIEEEFDGIDLPKEIKDLEKRGLVVRFNKTNLRCHNKYFYAFREFPEKTIITVDDDLQYNHHTVAALIKNSKIYHKCIIYNRGNRIIKYTPSNEWPFNTRFHEPSFEYFPNGVGGVLYPPHCCHRLVTDEEIIRKTCIKADDVWLNFMSRLNGTKVVCTGLASTFMILPDTDQKHALWASNNDSIIMGNDTQINNISNHFTNMLSCDYFTNI